MFIFSMMCRPRYGSRAEPICSVHGCRQSPWHCMMLDKLPNFSRAKVMKNVTKIILSVIVSVILRRRTAFVFRLQNYN